MTSPQKSKWLQRSFYGLALLCLILILIAKIPWLGNRATASRHFYGNLYTLSQIADFRLPISVNAETTSTTREEADVITIGDSFFDVALGGPRFSVRFENATNLKTFNVKYDLSKEVFTETPHVYVEKHPVSRPTLFIWERTEWNLVSDILDARQSKNEIELFDLLPGRFQGPRARGKIEQARDLVFQDHSEPLMYLLQHSILTEPLFRTLNTMRFHWTGAISPLTPEYSTEPLMLFYGPTLNTTRIKLHDNEIKRIADHIKKESEILAEQSVTPIFIPLPSKETVYRFLLKDSSYNDFIPRLTKELRARKIRVLNILPDYEKYARNNEELLYFPTDTHWNPRGMRMMISELQKMLRKANLPARSFEEVD